MARDPRSPNPRWLQQPFPARCFQRRPWEAAHGIGHRSRVLAEYCSLQSAAYLRVLGFSKHFLTCRMKQVPAKLFNRHKPILPAPMHHCCPLSQAWLPQVMSVSSLEFIVIRNPVFACRVLPATVSSSGLTSFCRGRSVAPGMCVMCSRSRARPRGQHLQLQRCAFFCANGHPS